MRKRSALWKLYAKHVHASCNLHAFMRCEVYNKRVHVPPAEKFAVFLTNARSRGISEWINYVVAWLPRDACRASRGKKIPRSSALFFFSNLVIDTKFEAKLSNYFLASDE